jgi:hypothetical protein
MSQALLCTNCKNESVGDTIYSCHDCEKEFCTSCKSRHLSNGIICPHCQSDNWKERASAGIIENTGRQFVNVVAMELPERIRQKKGKTKHLQLAILGLMMCFGASFFWEMNKFTVTGFVAFWGMVTGAFLFIKNTANLVRRLVK